MTTLPLRHPRWQALVRDAFLAARGQKVSTIAGVLVVALVCIVVLVTTGRTAATEQEVVGSISGLGARIIAVTDASGDAGIQLDSVAAVEDLEGVTWAFGLGDATEGTNAGLPAQPGVTMRALIGELPEDVALLEGRGLAAEHEALVGTAAQSMLGLVDVVGAVTDRQQQVGTVGLIEASGILSFLNESVLYRPGSTDGLTVRYIYVAVDDANQAEFIAADIAAVIHAEHPEGVDVAVSDSVIALGDVVSGQLGESARQLMVMVLAAGLVLVALTTFASVSARRRDFGRRRALGASRSALVALVVMQTTVSAVIGALVGSVIGAVLIVALTGTSASAMFVTGVATLAIVMAAVAALAPALLGATRDPVTVLRVP